MKEKCLKLILILFIFSFLRIEPTNAFFTARAVLIDNRISAGYWASSGEVVINELMWMGSFDESADHTNEDDEWLELKNTTAREINLNGWTLTALTGTDNHWETVIAFDNQTIPAGGYFLITRLSKEASKINVEPNLIFPNLRLRNTNLQLKLWDNRGNLIDTADDGAGSPLAGANEVNLKASMARKAPPGDGTLKENWFTSGHPAETRNYWDSGSENLGTPGGENF